MVIIIGYSIEIIVITLSIIYYFKVKNSIYKYLFFYLFFIALVEISGNVVRQVFLTSSYFVYNIYILVTFLFNFLFYKQLFRNDLIKKIINLFIIIFIGTFLYEFFGELTFF